MSAKKPPVTRTKDEHGTKEKLVDKVVSLLSAIKTSDGDKDELKANLLGVSNKKLLRLFEVGAAIKDKFGNVEKLAEETAKLVGKAKDAPYISKLKGLSAAKLYDMFRVANKKKAA